MRDWVMRVVVGVLALVVGLSPARGDVAAPAGYERWYVIELQGKPAGWMHELQKTNDAGQVITTSSIEFKIARLDQKMRVAMGSQFVETAAGEPVRMASEQSLGLGTVRTEYEFTSEGVTQRTIQNGRTTESKLEAPKGEWLTPAETRAFIEARIRAGAEEISYVTIDPNTGLQLVTQTHKVIGASTVEAMGKTVPSVKWSVKQDIMKGVESIEWVDEKGVPIRTEMDLGGIKMTVLASEKEVALADITPPEIMAQTLVKPDKDIVHPRTTRRAVYVLSVPSGELPTLPSAGGQRAEAIDATSARVTIDADVPRPLADGDAEDPDYSRATPTADSNDPRIAGLVKEATKELAEGASKMERAEAMRVFVNKFINEKSLGVGFATASEVAVTKEGDCSEHGVLLAAMLRADGIPARVVSGLLYVDQFMKEQRVFGYHMWAQALLEVDGKGCWVDFDAVLPPGPRFDATHIAISTSDLSDDGVINSMVPLTTVLGRLKIVVESAE